jgi:hypothetical protein
MASAKAAVKYRADHNVEIHKHSQRRLNLPKMEAQIEKIIDRALKGRGNRGWTIKVENKSELDFPLELRGQYTYKCKLRITCDNDRRGDDAIQKDFDNIIKFISTAGALPEWAIVFIDGKSIDERTKDTRIVKSVGYVALDIPKEWPENFTHIYDRESQIEVLISCVQAGIDSNFSNRFHCALVGDPACGKTETLRALKNVVGEDAVLEYDATATTQAGAIQDLNERDELPRIIMKMSLTPVFVEVLIAPRPLVRAGR